MPEFSLNELAETTGAAAANFGIKLAKGARDFHCKLYHDYPTWIVGGVFGNNPVTALYKGINDTVCKDSPSGLPPGPTSQFNGGQCICTGYKVITYCTGKTPDEEFKPVITQNLWGPIVSVFAFKEPNNWVVRANCRGYTYQDCGSTNYDMNIIGGYGNIISLKVDSVSVSTLNSQADNCGNPPPAPQPIVEPPPASLTQIFNTTYNDGTDFTIPLTYAPVNMDLDINVDVGGVAFKFNVDKVNFDWNFGPDGQPNDPPFNPPPSLPPSGNGPNGNNTTLNNKIDNITNKINVDINPKLDDLKDDVDDIIDKVNKGDPCCPEPPDPDKQIKVTGPTVQSATVGGIVGLLSLELHVTQFTNQAKIQFGDNSPNVLYAGWLEFRRGSNCYERLPIQFRDNIFMAPVGADGYAYCITYAGKARVDYYKKLT